MLVQINTDNRIAGSAGFSQAMETRLRERLDRFSSRLTRVELHVRDVDGTTNGANGVEAKLEVRPAGGAPLLTTAQGPDPDAALAGALRKIVELLDRAFGKQDAVR